MHFDSSKIFPSDSTLTVRPARPCILYADSYATASTINKQNSDISNLRVSVFCAFLPRDASAERGDAAVSRLSVRL